MKSLKDLLRTTHSPNAMLAGVTSGFEKNLIGTDKVSVTPQLGKKGTPMRRIIAYRREGPFYRQTGVRVVADSTIPMLQQWFSHHFQHATKGWRVFKGGPLLKLPQATALPMRRPAGNFPARGWQNWRAGYERAPLAA